MSQTRTSPPVSTVVIDTWRVRVTGVVQGVGYRPFVYKLAHELGVQGWVRNDPEGVLIETQGVPDVLDRFIADLSDRAPALAVVNDVIATRLPEPLPAYEQFVIVESEHTGTRQAIIPPDSYVCADCLRELRDPQDRRHRYPFITCTNCGPRYSIVRDLPYDRAQTTMSSFVMCEDCEREYRDPADRRYHAQPNGCWDCGPTLELVDRHGVRATGEEALRRCSQALLAGQVAAIKSVGGFHLAVDASSTLPVGTLRKRKRRDSKPFAVMVRDLAAAQRLVQLSQAEADLLGSPARPILLARKRPGQLPEEVAPRNPNLGLMLPSAAHHHMLLEDTQLAALVMTSGNISGRPIVYQNDEALKQLFDVADVVLMHDRDIEVRVDDSVVRLSEHPTFDEPLLTFFRRARGYAPFPVNVGRSVRPIVAYGAELKSTVAVTAGSNVYLSQHIGDLKNDETFASHRRIARHLAQLYDVTPRYGVYDLHPQFRSTASAASGSAGPPLETDGHRFVQHHHAHMAACMAENKSTGTTLGVLFDGVGYGLDGSAWGGEFLLGDYRAVDRVAHLRQLPLIGGDQAVREPIRTGYALALDAFGDAAAAVAAFPALEELSDDQRHVYGVMATRGVNSPPSSSMGRLFDGIAALLGVCSRAEYEAQGPIELEGLLSRDLAMDTAAGYTFGLDEVDGITIIDPRPVVAALAADGAADVPVADVSRRFHTAVVNLVVEICRQVRGRTGTGQVALSGGVFLNEFLLVNSLTTLRAEAFDVVCHRQVPVNDGGIALGQVMVADAKLAHEELA